MLSYLLTEPAPEHLYWKGADDGAHRLTWQGVAGFSLINEQKTLCFDPYVSRSSLFDTVFRPLHVDGGTLEERFPRADAILIGHAHYDHVLDAPALAARTGATVYGCPSTARVCRGWGLPDHQIWVAAPDEEVELVHGRARAIPSEHGKFFMNKGGYPHGHITEPIRYPPRMKQLKHGQVFTWWAEWGGLRVVHVDSADYDTERMRKLDCDVLCLCAIGRKYRPAYTREIIDATQPKYVVPCHWDHFFLPLGAPTRSLPGIDLDEFTEEIAACGATPVVLPIGGSLGIG